MVMLSYKQKDAKVLKLATQCTQLTHTHILKTASLVVYIRSAALTPCWPLASRSPTASSCRTRTHHPAAGAQLVPPDQQ